MKGRIRRKNYHRYADWKRWDSGTGSLTKAESCCERYVPATRALEHLLVTLAVSDWYLSILYLSRFICEKCRKPLKQAHTLWKMCLLSAFSFLLVHPRLQFLPCFEKRQFFGFDRIYANIAFVFLDRKTAQPPYLHPVSTDKGIAILSTNRSTTVVVLVCSYLLFLSECNRSLPPSPYDI